MHFLLSCLSVLVFLCVQLSTCCTGEFTALCAKTTFMTKRWSRSPKRSRGKPGRCKVQQLWTHSQSYVWEQVSQGLCGVKSSKTFSNTCSPNIFIPLNFPTVFLFFSWYKSKTKIRKKLVWWVPLLIVCLKNQSSYILLRQGNVLLDKIRFQSIQAVSASSS